MSESNPRSRGRSKRRSPEPSAPQIAVESDLYEGTTRVGYDDENFVQVSLKDLPDVVKATIVHQEIGRRLKSALKRGGLDKAQELVKTWQAGRTDLRRKEKRPSITAEAYAKVLWISPQEAEKRLAGMSKDERREVRERKDVKAMALRVKAERLEE